MPHTIMDGPFGIEGIWTLASTTFGVPSLAIGDLSNPAAYYILDQVDGVMDSSDMTDDPRDKLPGRMGEISYPRQRWGKTLTFTGRVMAANRQLMRQLNAAANAAFSSVSPATLVITSLIPGSPAFYYLGTALAYAASDVQALGPTTVPTPWQRPFVASFRCSDPRCYVWGTPVSASGASGVAGTVALGGLAPTAPVFTINGPTTTGVDTPTVTIHNLSTGVVVEVNLQSGMLSTDVLVVDLGARTATVNGLDVTSSINWQQSSWLQEGQEGIYPGSCSVRVDGAGSWSCSTQQAVW